MNLQKLLEYYLLVEAPFDAWLRKNPNQNTEQARKYFDDLTTRYNASLHPLTKDLTNLSFEQLETLHKAVEKAKEKNLKTLQTQWLTKQIKEKNLNSKAIEEDYIPVLQAVAKYKDLMQPEVLNQINSIEELNVELNKVAPQGTISVASDAELGKIAEKDGWAVYMPHTTEASCELGKTAGRRDTTWCTTRTENNLFLTYAARADADIILFYVIKKGINAEKEPFAKMSVGFINGEPRFNQGDGNISVNAANENLTEEKFKQVVGKDIADYFLSSMQQKAKEIQGKHPAKQEFEKLIQNPKAFLAKLESFKKDEQGQEFRLDFINQSLKYPNVLPEVLSILAEDKSVDIRVRVAGNPNTLPDTLEILAIDKNVDVRASVAGNPNTLPDTLEFLAEDKSVDVRASVAENPKTLPDTLEILAIDKNVDVRASVAGNPNTPPDTLEILAKDEDQHVRYYVAKNPKTSPDTLKILAKDEDQQIRYKVAENLNTSPDTLKILAEDKISYVRYYVAENPKTLPDTLEILAKDEDQHVRYYVAKNPNTSPDTLKILAKDEDQQIRYKVAEIGRAHV